jgi:hypothetical protein
MTKYIATIGEANSNVASRSGRCPNHGGFADVAMDLAATFGKLASDELGGAVLFEAKLGMCM